MVEEDGLYRNALTFNEWRGQEADLSSIAHIINEPYDHDHFDYFGKLSMFQSDESFHIIVNNPNKLQTTDYFFVLDSDH